jgi:hypothetical protein
MQLKKRNLLSAILFPAISAVFVLTVGCGGDLEDVEEFGTTEGALGRSYACHHSSFKTCNNEQCCYKENRTGDKSCAPGYEILHRPGRDLCIKRQGSSYDVKPMRNCSYDSAIYRSGFRNDRHGNVDVCHYKAYLQYSSCRAGYTKMRTRLFHTSPKKRLVLNTNKSIKGYTCVRFKKPAEDRSCTAGYDDERVGIFNDDFDVPRSKTRQFPLWSYTDGNGQVHDYVQYRTCIRIRRPDQRNATWLVQ